jgi:hypothetical protein
MFCPIHAVLNESHGLNLLLWTFCNAPATTGRARNGLRYNPLCDFRIYPPTYSRAFVLFLILVMLKEVGDLAPA